MKFKDIITKGFAYLLALTAITGLSSCNGLMYDEQGDCDPHYKVKFEYRYHLEGKNGKYADAFAENVEAVTLYLIDTNGTVVWQKSESGEALASGNYLMDVDVAPGQYSLLAWCGSGVGSHFTVNSTGVASDLHCRLNRDYDDDNRAVSKLRLNDLYHGHLDLQEFPDDEGTYIYTVPLVKDTNDFTIILHQLSGEAIDPSMFEFTITDNNGWLDWMNNPFDNEEINYGSHHFSSLTSGQSGVSGSDVDLSAGGLISGHTTSRLTATGRDSNNNPNDGNLWLTVKRVSGFPEVTHSPSLSRSGDGNGKEPKVVLRIPLTAYCLKVKDIYYSEMSDQEFLDRCDDYTMVFFLDEGYRWVEMNIHIHSFKVVQQNVEIK